jgi:hypothetical protein
LGRPVIATLTDAQRAALQTLAAIVDPTTYLAGGVAVAIHLGHRASRDLDLFVPESDPVDLVGNLEAHAVRILSRSEGTLYLDAGGVPTSLLRYRYPLLSPPQRFDGIAVPVASQDDLVCMKLSALAGRGAARDFWDLHALLTAERRPLAEALESYRRKYSAEDLGHVVRSLVYFDDATSAPLPAGLTEAHWEEIKTTFRRWVAAL